MHFRPLVSIASRLLCQLHKVLDCLRRGLAEQADDDTSGRLAANAHVKVHLRALRLVSKLLGKQIVFVTMSIFHRIPTYLCSHLRPFIGGLIDRTNNKRHAYGKNDQLLHCARIRLSNCALVYIANDKIVGDYYVDLIQASKY
jgi:hypothetical protein